MKTILITLVTLITFSLSAQKKETYIYSIKGKDTLRMDVFTPKNIKKSDSLPVLLWMHGGGFSGSHRAYPDDTNLVKYAAEKQNYIGVSIDYRLLRKNKTTGFGCDCTKDEKMETFKQAAIDYLDAAKFLVERAQMLQIDPTKIIAGGSSAGAEGILNAVYMKDYFVTDKNAYISVSFAGVFSCAGAVVDARYITKENAVPTVLYHGTEDRLVPFANASHHYCNPKKDGYIMLDGSEIIANQLEKFDTAYSFNIVKGGGHEIARIPFEDLEKVFRFFEQTMLNKQVIQTKIIRTK
ncbi:putative lipase/esterase [Winogradskyella psychrotolerans RS-3]|uniref:Putative lipase/esterase n=1 Tax=Winogradskyella psychrotolerans RS-3 TaxID=641526 RepID=S7VX21_9FLAO|nr:carboxylesterase family protein [Winogradskyella psychrotolerans]EPR74845.1 putative lipase/esterase [Winogradskyella psychrotolerans RS-3]